MKKRIIFVFLCVFLLAGCGKSDDLSDVANSANVDNLADEDKQNDDQSIQNNIEIPGDFCIEDEFNIDISQYFIDYSEGCFVLKLENSNMGISYQEKLAEDRRSPLSTFKVMSSLILLEEEVVENLDQAIPWDGTVYSVESWNGEQTLKSAFENSVVWVYKKLLSNIEDTTIESYLERVNYGNKDITGGEGFWLDSSLEISLKEQISFLEGVYNNKFDFNQNNIDKIKEMMLLDQTENYKLYGKTGSDDDGTNIFIGYIEVGERVYFFASYVYEPYSGYNIAKDITYKVIDQLF